MRRLKDDIGIVEDRTAERNIEFNTETWQLFMSRKKTPNKFIDIDTLVLTGKGLLNGNLVPFIIKSIYYRNVNNYYATLVYFDHENSSDEYGELYDDAGHTIELNFGIGSGSESDLDFFGLDDIMNKGFESLSDIHIYYAYTPYQFIFVHEN